jgi:lipoprotein NlpD
MLAGRTVAAVAMNRSWIRLACVLLAATLLAACGHSRVVKREGGAVPAASARAGAATYVVRRGDTLYGIAFRHGLDYRDVAALNRIPAPYTIYPGQRLTLRAGATSGSRAAGTPPRSGTTSRPPSGTVATAPGGTRTTAPGTAASPRPATGSPTPVTRPGGTTSAGTAPMIPPPLATTPAPTPPPPMATVPAAGAVGPTGWRWPTQGTLIGRFAAGDPKRQGVDIAGSSGQAVVAAADGTVVYSGAGLVGYGELIIVKHSDEWLSAYAHNRRRLVAEGAVVNGGQPIAELGRSGTSRDMLHFEVRRNGKPVDPLTVLPPH